MNLVLLSSSDFVSDEVAVLRDPRRVAHIRNVLRSSEGEALEVGVVGGKCGRGAVVRISESEVELAVDVYDDPPAPLPLTLIVALPRPKVLNRVIASAASLGVKELWFVNAWRVEKSYWSSPRLAPDNLLLQSLLGLEQAKDTVLPAIHTARLFRRFVEDELPALSADSLRLFAHPVAAAVTPRAVAQRVTLVVGPEGGFIDEEIASLERAGFSGVSLGRRVLRTETAVAALIGRLF